MMKRIMSRMMKRMMKRMIKRMIIMKMKMGRMSMRKRMIWIEFQFHWDRMKF